MQFVKRLLSRNGARGMLSSMEATQLRKWCDARRGRLSMLAKALNVPRQFVWQWTRGDRPIPEATLPLVLHEIKRAERLEAEGKPRRRRAAASKAAKTAPVA
jgi:hypothetical protein